MRITDLNLGEVYEYETPDRSIEIETRYLDEYGELVANAACASETELDAGYAALRANALSAGLSVLGVNVGTSKLVSMPGTFDHEFRIGVFADRDSGGLDDYLVDRYGTDLRGLFAARKEWPYHTLPDWQGTLDKLLDAWHSLFDNAADAWYSTALYLVIETVSYAMDHEWGDRHVIRWNSKRD